MDPRVSHSAHKKPPLRVFFAMVVVVFFSTLSTADSIGFVPCALDGSCVAQPSSVALSNLPELGQTLTPAPAGVLPVHISIDAINLDLPVQNPDTRDVPTLDELLTNGPVRYVDSAKLGVSGNMLIFAHTSHLPIVHNKMFQAFNNIPSLKAGDLVTLKGENGTSYLYSVTSVRKADASEATINLSPSLGTKLTLVTCDTLTSKDARYILEADFVGSI